MNTLFPVLLKCTTCIITDKVSIIGIIAITTKISGIFKYKAIPAIAQPKSNEPVSPINTFAGCKLNNKNPKHAPIRIAPISETSGTLKIIPIIVNAVINCLC